MYPFFFKIVHYYVDKTESFVDMLYFLKIAVLSPILSTALCRQHYIPICIWHLNEQSQHRALNAGSVCFQINVNFTSLPAMTSICSSANHKPWTGLLAMDSHNFFYTMTAVWKLLTKISKLGRAVPPHGGGSVVGWFGGIIQQSTTLGRCKKKNIYSLKKSFLMAVPCCTKIKLNAPLLQLQLHEWWNLP